MLSWADGAILALYLALLPALAWWLSRTRDDSDAEPSTAGLLDGTARASSGVAGLALVSSLLSAVSLLGTPAEGGFGAGLQFALLSVGVALGTWFTAAVLLPPLFEAGAPDRNAYAWLGGRFGSARVQQVASVLFLLKTVGYATVVSLAPGLVAAAVGAGPVMRVVATVCASRSRCFVSHQSRSLTLFTHTLALIICEGAFHANTGLYHLWR